jgi:Domain of unknown function (DUF1707)
MARHSSLRASDADRDAVAERLRQAAVEGRLDADELEQRLHRALRAKTYGDLNRLLGDLPAKPVKWERPRRGVAPAAGFALAMVLKTFVALVVLGAVLVVAAATFAWWLIGLIVVLAIRSSSHGCRTHRRHASWHRPPHVRRV